jgi:hypothetical protein
MALTITRQGSEISTEKLVFTATTDDVVNTTSVLMEIFINSTAVAHTFEHFPDFGTTDEFSFEINSIVKDYFASEFLPLTGANQTAIENALVDMKFYEVFGTVVQAATYSDEVVIKNITQDVFEIEDFDLADYDCGDTGSSSSKLLTSCPSVLPIGDLTSIHVSCLKASYSGVAPTLTPKQEWTIDTYLNGVAVAQTTEALDVPNRVIPNEASGNKHDISTYRFDFDQSQGYDEVRIYVRDIAAPQTRRSEIKTFKLNDSCEKDITLSWLNEFGTQDTFTFLGNIERSGKYTDDTYKRVRPVNPLSTDVGDLVYKSSYNYQYDLFSDRMPEAQVQWLSKILINKRAAIQSKSSKVNQGLSKSSKVNQGLSLTGDTYHGNMPEAASYFGLVDAGNGFAYGAPGRSGNFLKYDLSNDTTSTIATAFPSGGAVQYTWGIKSNVNGKIYYMNSATSDILVFNPIGETHTTIGVLTDTYNQPAITPSGIIYANGNGKVLKIDTNTDTVSEIAAVGKEAGGFAIYSGGFVYLVPNGTNNEFYKLDISDDSIATVAAASLESGTISGVLTSGGKIYCYVQGATVKNKIVVIDTSDDSSYSFDTGVALANGYRSTFLLSDDNVYLLGFAQADILKIDTTNDSVSVAGIITDNQNYDLSMVVNDVVYAPSGIQNEQVIKLVFEESILVTAGKYFPIVIETDDTILEDKLKINLHLKQYSE